MNKRRKQRTAGVPTTNKYIAMRIQTLKREEEAGFRYDSPGEEQRRLSQLLRYGIIDYEEFVKRRGE